MKNDVNKESPIETISVKNDFDGFNYDEDIYDNYESKESERQMFDTNKIDEFVNNEDYMGFQEYLDELEDEDKNQALEYIENNYPEFMEDDEGATFEPMKGGKFDPEKEIAKDFSKKPNFDKVNIKSDLGETLLNSYKNAA